MLKRLLMILCALAVLTGCSKSEYSDASVEVPANWADYTVENMDFRFEAGWKSGSWDEVQTNMDAQAQTIEASNNLAIFGRLVSPLSAQDTTNYVDFGYWDTGHPMKTAELETIMEQVDDLILTIKKMGVESNELQTSRIRFYGEVEAMTFSYLLEKDNVQCVIQAALIPHGTRVYMVAYFDFGSTTDNSMLEQLLSTLSFND